MGRYTQMSICGRLRRRLQNKRQRQAGCLFHVV